MSEATARPVFIDTDPGIDDAVAILFALGSALFDIRGITTVAGNIGIETTTRNACRILALAGRSDIPVVAGASAPLARRGFDTADIHGGDGLGGVPFPEPAAPPLGGDAASWLAERLLKHEPGTFDILALGPLTNLAKLLRDAPEAAGRIGRIVAMGGAVEEPGNVGTHAEFNLAADPEAADMILRSGLDLTLVPLDVTRRVRASRPWVRSLRETGTVAAAASADLIEAYFQTTTGGESRPLHDPCVMLFAIRPDIFSCERYALTIDISDGSDAGALQPAEDGPIASVAMRVDAERALSLLLETLGRR
ncbi:nucleoside hydrolase [Nitratireductor mangrovi]|uniref:Nucleoside hydrolase n=1 Tax=Nitratireductor mangrovi TaxID=2599600 RepID=A0A5B8KYR0_9HYPH|nr:nucleoside hydrolase [Nitratireductor mangrovi]QDZ00867.1 nucleoside hydrolase [Nitratireductor mangrovi]